MPDWLSMGGEVFPSAKMTALKCHLVKWFRDAPNDKVIIFSQFLLTQKIIERLCEDENWGYKKASS
jgi:hypothetical protein